MTCAVTVSAAAPSASLVASELGILADRDQGTPGKTRLFAGEHALDRFRRHGHRPRHGVERELAALRFHDAERQCLGDAAQAWIAGEHLNQGLGRDQPVEREFQLFRWLEQKAVAGEELAAARYRN